MKPAIVIDFETTGLTLPPVANLEDQPYIIEIGAARVENGKVVARMSQLVNPERLIEPVITKITGITNEQLVPAPLFATVAPELIEIAKGCQYFIAHNAPFDSAVLRYALRRHPELPQLSDTAPWPVDSPWPPQTICTVQEFEHMFGRRPKLTELYERATGKPLAQTHRALDDVEALVEALDALQFWIMLH